METAEQFIKRKEEEYQKGKKIKVKDISRKGYHYWIIESWIFMQQSNSKEKVFVLEKLRKAETEGILRIFLVQEKEMLNIELAIIL